MNAAFDTKGLAVLRSVGDTTPSLDAQLAAMRHDKALSKLLEGAGSMTKAPRPGEGEWRGTGWHGQAGGCRFD